MPYDHFDAEDALTGERRPSNQDRQDFDQMVELAVAMIKKLEAGR